ncbi:hypothetical protein MVEG_11003 [Podila verticillata NRRL 6337]|uniref:Uncharacterized protein n=1 Tax=Podila verticillata NRRL 6337 TaxID=1069443 RepID=A0A086TLY8_9FUNG|nr:hypothetical protein MVEG_11003 [Podila verticillata NRRL 6337]
MQDIQACRQVNKQRASMFKVHLWSILNLPSTADLTNYEKFDTFRKTNTGSDPWSSLLNALTDDLINWELTHLQKPVLYDESFEHTRDKGRPLSMGTGAIFIDSNKKNFSSF